MSSRPFSFHNFWGILGLSDCRPGMKVRHVALSSRSGGAGLGEIIAVTDDGALVEFETGLRGLYDEAWFRCYPDVWLEELP